MSPRREGLGKPKGYSPSAEKLRYVVDSGAASGLPDKMQKGEPFLVMGIESSCDDTGVSVVRSDGVILSNVVYSQHEIHEKFGGIVPSLAMDEHAKNIEIAVIDSLKQAGLSSVDDVDAIAVTKGPGLEICLRVGCRKAQQLAVEYEKPFVTVHHLEAHCFMARMAGEVITDQEQEQEQEQEQHNRDDDDDGSDALSTAAAAEADVALTHFDPKVKFPFLALLVSGGHTSIMVCRGIGAYEVLGGTLYI
jgi:N6-L-threonylcarbamoyladenine synthase